jgi:hypothetical protein
LWESDPDPDAEWIVLKIPNGNDFYFMADFVDGDVMDGSEWLEGPFDQAITVTNLLDIKRRGRTVRRERGSHKTEQDVVSGPRVKYTPKNAGRANLERRPINREWTRTSPFDVDGDKAVIAESPPPREHERYRLHEGKHLDLESLYKGERKRQKEIMEEDSSAPTRANRKDQEDRISRVGSSSVNIRDQPKAPSLFLMKSGLLGLKENTQREDRTWIMWGTCKKLT